ncbi:uncharacterized protein LOC131874383 [Cryptomeria japonica]|uniref:uncharacterized protein LOC131874383 n=1 Tax=Cryptomeria japonica TaxID=3369 RepID=UPI0027DA8285|nr:uncharacterized protein LOC131874383 [Cryptomeria japonica]
MQNHHLIVYESRKLKDNEKLYSTYDKEMLTIMHALSKFRQYLVGRKFIVRTDHNSLKYFLRQKDLNERQQKWVSKIQAYDFDLKYVKGKNNVAADALSRKPSIAALCSLSEISADWKCQLLVEYSKNQHACEIMDGIVQDDKYTIVDDVIYYKGRIYLVPESKLKNQILHAFHDTPVAGHQGYAFTHYGAKMDQNFNRFYHGSSQGARERLHEDLPVLQMQEQHPATQQLQDQLMETEIDCVVSIGLYDMMYMPVIRMNHGLVTALVERWHSDTCIFHLSMGEMTITLEDVWRILHIPIRGDLVIEHMVTDGTRYVWGPSVLSHLYRELHEDILLCSEIGTRQSDEAVQSEAGMAEWIKGVCTGGTGEIPVGASVITRLTSVEARVEDCEAEIAARDVQLFAWESELTIVLRDRYDAVERLRELQDRG